MKNRLVILLAALLSACAPSDKYDPREYSKTLAENAVLPKIVSHIFTAPPYVSMKDRLKPEYLPYYVSVSPDFSIQRYFVAPDETHYFYLIRKAGKTGELRAVGGHFKINANHQLTDFREMYVTPVLPEAELKGRCLFLFDEMVKGTLAPYLKMATYVQWPNPASYYDSTVYEWRLTPEAVQSPR